MPAYNTLHVDFPRSLEIQRARQALPVSKEEYEIMEAIIDNDIVLVTGATGSGKTTQVPQFLLEAGFGNARSLNPGKVILTQPRRLAVVSSAERIRNELGANHYVSYRTRHESSIHSESLLDIVTDGVLIRELIDGPLLDDYSAIILDEVHERSYNGDFLIALLCKIVKIRNETHSSRPPLRLILMSATIQSDIVEFVNGFGKARQISVQGQTFPVSVHYNRSNPDDYVGAVSKKVNKIISRLPAGKILAFLPSKADLKACEENLKGLDGVNVICVHGSMSKNQQCDIFNTARNGIDVFLATNVAETSITIPEVTYIVDSGKVKRKIFDDESGTFRFVVDWISKASALQRMGRTGRTNAGHCYRLYTADTFYETFDDHDEPEITKIRLDSHVLLCLRLGIEEPSRLSMPTCPSNEQYKLAVERLTQLQVINKEMQIKDEFLLICELPILPECAVLIIQAILQEFEIKRLSLAVLFCLTMCFDEICYDRKEYASNYRSYFKSDVMFDAFLASGYFSNIFKVGLNEKSLIEISKLYDQITKLLVELIDTKLLSLPEICFEKRICDSVRALCKYSPKYLTAVRTEICTENSRCTYMCCDNEMTVGLSKRSFLYSDSPRIVSFRGRIIGTQGKCILTRITDISK